MFVQHLLTERIFKKVFENPDFVKKSNCDKIGKISKLSY